MPLSKFLLRFFQKAGVSPYPLPGNGIKCKCRLPCIRHAATLGDKNMQDARAKSGFWAADACENARLTGDMHKKCAIYLCNIPLGNLGKTIDNTVGLCYTNFTDLNANVLLCAISILFYVSQ